MFRSNDTIGDPTAVRPAPGPVRAPALSIADLVFLLNCYDIWSGPKKSVVPCACWGRESRARGEQGRS